MKKKLFVTILSLVLVVTMMPLSVFANTNSDNGEPKYGTHEYWEQKEPNCIYVGSITPGQVFTTGTYCFAEDITVESTEEGQSGIVINGDVTFIIEDGHTLTVKGADATCSKDASEIKGSGAGIELTEGNILWIKGKGTVDAQSGKVYVKDEVTKGGDAGETTRNDTGKGGKGGQGTGGVGAAIGTPGGAGGLGAKATNGRHEGSIFKDYDGRDGANGQNGQASANAGTLKVSGAVEVKTTVGGVSTYIGLGGTTGSGDDDDYFLPKRTNGMSAGGGAGGQGGLGAQIGSGGSGGAGGGAGGSGGIVTKFKRPNGGGGGAGAGAGYADRGTRGHCSDEWDGSSIKYKNDSKDGGYVSDSIQGGAGGCGANGGNNPGGNGGNGGDTSYAGSPGKCYATTLEESEAGEESINGRGAPVYHVYPSDECEVKIIGLDGDTPTCEVRHIPTGAVLDESDYHTVYNKGEDSITVSGINRGTDENPVFTLADESMEKEGHLIIKVEAEITVKCYFQDLTSDGKDGADTYTESVDLERHETAFIGQITFVEATEVSGYTARPIQQKIVKEDGTTVVEIYYDRNVHNLILNKGEHSAWSKDKYAIPVSYGASIQKNLPEGYDLAEQGYRFAGWSEHFVSGLQEIDPSTTMKDSDVELTAQWEKML